ncbi:hypothetical protein NDU88_008261 [Pleurodeles waltl]|uniref:Uncharacterized protein n=1 Tax=Pleurodeles waltl TaxID=8319 RepID=A0AAV7QU16_PLEWA|nr:hypothetical protein NDU88_008261 [Pleurodeles waltl]
MGPARYLLHYGKTDKSQSKLQFKTRRTPKTCEDGGAADSGRKEVEPEESGKLHQILTATQHSLLKIDGRRDALYFRLDRMSEHLDNHTECLDMFEERVSEAEDEQVINVSSTKSIGQVDADPAIEDGRPRSQIMEQQCSHSGTC